MTATTPLALARTHSLWKLDAELQDLTERAQEEEAGPCPGCDGKQLIPTPTGPVTCPECAGKGTGVISAATQEALTAYFEATVQKVDRVAEFLKFLKALEETCKAEAARISERRHVAENTAERIKNMLKEFMAKRGDTQIKSKLNTISLCRNSQPSLEIQDATVIYGKERIASAKVPAKFQRIQITVTREWWDQFVESCKFDGALLIPPAELARKFMNISAPFIDESALRDHLAAGETIEGATLETGRHIRVR